MTEGRRAPALVVRALADGRPRDRVGLARECGIDGAALDRALERLSRLGVALIVEPEAVALPRPVDLLDAGRILRAVPRLRPEAVHLRFAVDSTNAVLAERLRAGVAAPELCTAEIQTAGRGRHGRGWISGLGQSLVLSVSWRFTTRFERAERPLAGRRRRTRRGAGRRRVRARDAQMAERPGRRRPQARGHPRRGEPFPIGIGRVRGRGRLQPRSRSGGFRPNRSAVDRFRTAVRPDAGPKLAGLPGGQRDPRCLRAVSGPRP